MNMTTELKQLLGTDESMSLRDRLKKIREILEDIIPFNKMPGTLKRLLFNDPIYIRNLYEENKAMSIQDRLETIREILNIITDDKLLREFKIRNLSIHPSQNY